MCVHCQTANTIFILFHSWAILVNCITFSSIWYLVFLGKREINQTIRRKGTYQNQQHVFDSPRPLIPCTEETRPFCGCCGVYVHNTRHVAVSFHFISLMHKSNTYPVYLHVVVLGTRSPYHFYSFSRWSVMCVNENDATLKNNKLKIFQ